MQQIARQCLIVQVLKYGQEAIHSDANYHLKLNVQHLGVLVVKYRAEMQGLIEDAKVGLLVVFYAKLGVHRLHISIGVR